MRSITFGLSIAIGVLMAVPGCGVPQKQHDTTVAKLRSTQQQFQMAKADVKRERERAQEAQGQTNRLRARLKAVQGRLGALNRMTAAMRRQLKACQAKVVPPRRKHPLPGPAVAAPKTTGPLGAAAVRKGINKILKRVKRCYRKRGKKQTGKLVVSFQIKRGKARKVRVTKNTLKNRRLAKCVRRAVRKARFAKSKKVTKVTYPFRFSAK